MDVSGAKIVVVMMTMMVMLVMLVMVMMVTGHRARQQPGT